MKTLIHICCANCALYPITKLLERKMSFEGFWYNPNIHPAEEYIKRLEAVKQIEAKYDLTILYKNVYGLKEFIRTVVFDEQNSCEHCYSMRLRQTALCAKQRGFEAFTTTLLFSVYQNYDLIIQTGKELESEYDLEFYIEDFRKGWKKGNEMSRALNLYRQKYCGCIYSELERYAKKLDKMLMKLAPLDKIS
ncbi:protein of unknown function DUF208 [Candidatus Magnetoovum chiemensis]|nr:protein of unknown function DUF208 [Candidatus Magnetoovum chiemensis]